MVPGKEDLEGQQDTEGRLLFSEQMPKTFPAEQAGPPSDGRLWPAGKKNKKDCTEENSCNHRHEGVPHTENEDYEVQETPNRKGRDWNSKNFQVSGYGNLPPGGEQVSRQI